MDDKFALGGRNAEGYVFRHWQCIDAFVYFSHNFVTIPPPVWINAAHRHGCPVFGTFITEWEKGTSMCDELLSNETKMQCCVNQLAKIAEFHGFEGWIVNIENDLPPSMVPKMIDFVTYLTKAMHTAVQGSEVIWYDAVTTEGKLDWQNALTKLNRPFFDACDGIWINYTWKEGDPGRIRDVAGERANDVYLGVDCFGRGTYGGGQMNTYLGLAAARNAGLNVALFGCCWPYEHYISSLSDDNVALSAVYPSWYDMDDEFWYRINKAWKFKRSTVLSLPFYSCFNVGAGSTYYANGKATITPPWYNMSLQSIQLLPWLHDRNITGGITTSVIRSYGFNGSNSVLIQGGIAEPCRIRLFSCNLPLFGHNGLTVRATMASTQGIETHAIIRVNRNTILDSASSLKENQETVILDLILNKQQDAEKQREIKSESLFSSPVIVKDASRALQICSISDSDVEKDPELNFLVNSGWVQAEVSINSTEVPAWVFQEGVAVCLDLVVHPSTPGSVCRCNLLLGDISAWFIDDPPPLCTPASSIVPDNIVLRQVKDDTGRLIGKSLSVRLTWMSNTNTQRFQIWMKTGSSRSNADGVEWGQAFMVGVSPIPTFVLRSIDLMQTTVAARIYVISEISGKVQNMRTAGSVTLTFPEADCERPGDEIS